MIDYVWIGIGFLIGGFGGVVGVMVLGCRF